MFTLNAEFPPIQTSTPYPAPPNDTNHYEYYVVFRVANEIPRGGGSIVLAYTDTAERL
ncbi:MAG: hypothetical protein AAGA68_25280 [Pseudomonadota bacterium]